MVRTAEDPALFDRLINLEEARKQMRGRQGNPPSLAAVRRWIKAGYRPRGGQSAPVRLQALRLGQDYLTLPEWVQEFEQARFRAGVSEPLPTAKPSTNRAAKKAHRLAERDLDRAGIGKS